MTAVLRALAGLLTHLPGFTFVYIEHAGDVVQHACPPVDDDCDCGECGLSPDPDQPRQVLHQMPSEGLWHLLARSARHAHNGADDEEAADLVMAELELEHTEFMAGDDD